MKDLTIWKALSHNVSMCYLCSGMSCSSLVKENIIGNLIFLTLNVFGSFLFVVPYERLNNGCGAGTVNHDTLLFSVLRVEKRHTGRDMKGSGGRVERHAGGGPRASSSQPALSRGTEAQSRFWL